MNSIRQIQRLNDAELAKCVPPNASWHTDYRDTAYIHIGGLPFDLSEGDVLTIFSQYGNPVHISLIRDKDTGKSRGFAFLKYEDQRSCDLAVDNLSGAGVLGRVLTVDHARYKLKEGEIEGEGMNDDVKASDDDETDREDNRRRKRRRTSSVSEEERPVIKEEIELQKLMREHDDDDPMKAYLVKEKKDEVADALKQLALQKDAGSQRKHRRRHDQSRRSDSEDGGRQKDRHPSRQKDVENEGDGRRRNVHSLQRRHDEDDRERPQGRRDDDDRSRRGHSRQRRSRREDEGHRRRRDEKSSSDDSDHRHSERRRSRYHDGKSERHVR